MLHDDTPQYTPPAITDYGTLAQLTANDGTPVVTDVPQGTQVSSGPVVGSTSGLS